MMNTVQIDFLEFQGKAQSPKGMSFYLALVKILIKNPSIYWNKYSRAWQFPTQYLPLTFFRKPVGERIMIVTIGMLEILSLEAKNQDTHKACANRFHSTKDW